MKVLYEIVLPKLYCEIPFYIFLQSAVSISLLGSPFLTSPIGPLKVSSINQGSWQTCRARTRPTPSQVSRLWQAYIFFCMSGSIVEVIHKATPVCEWVNGEREAAGGPSDCRLSIDFWRYAKSSLPIFLVYMFFLVVSR